MAYESGRYDWDRALEAEYSPRNLVQRRIIDSPRHGRKRAKLVEVIGILIGLGNKRGLKVI